MARGAMAEEMH